MEAARASARARKRGGGGRRTRGCGAGDGATTRIHRYRHCASRTAVAAHVDRPRALPGGACTARRRAEAAAALMATPEFAQWLARGRTHQWEGRPVDAMLCFRRRSEEHTSELQSRPHLVCRLLL